MGGRIRYEESQETLIPVGQNEWKCEAAWGVGRGESLGNCKDLVTWKRGEGTSDLRMGRLVGVWKAGHRLCIGDRRMVSLPRAGPNMDGE